MASRSHGADDGQAKGARPTAPGDFGLSLWLEPRLLCKNNAVSVRYYLTAPLLDVSPPLPSCPHPQKTQGISSIYSQQCRRRGRMLPQWPLRWLRMGAVSPAIELGGVRRPWPPALRLCCSRPEIDPLSQGLPGGVRLPRRILARLLPPIHALVVQRCWRWPCARTIRRPLHAPVSQDVHDRSAPGTAAPAPFCHCLQRADLQIVRRPREGRSPSALLCNAWWDSASPRSHEGTQAEEAEGGLSACLAHAMPRVVRCAQQP